MRSISTTQFFKALGIDRLFARPRTPNDNPQVESLFSTVKISPQYPGFFEVVKEARDYRAKNKRAKTAGVVDLYLAGGTNVVKAVPSSLKRCYQIFRMP